MHAVNVSQIRSSVNAGQQHGVYSLEGRVTSMPPPPPPPLPPPPPGPGRPAIGTPQFFAGYFQNTRAASSAYTPTGYTAAHASWYNERDHWRSQAYAQPQPRGTNPPFNAPLPPAPSRLVLEGLLQEVNVMACVSWLGEDPRGTPITVSVEFYFSIAANTSV